jgi:flavin-dependent dehydrogenase
MPEVVIRGDGVASYCCAYLLHRAGLSVSLEPVDRPRLPVIMLSDHALALIRDVFERPGLFNDRPRIRERVVAWGVDSKRVRVGHSAVVVSEELLLENLRPDLSAPGKSNGTTPDWTIFASRPLPPAAAEQHFGSRIASAVPVTLSAGVDSGACFIESLDQGWLFLIPNSTTTAWLLAVGDSPDHLLKTSRVVSPQIAELKSNAGEFPAYPRILSPLCVPGWLACGTAAMAFDPICGDGTAHAVREAILAAAVIRSVAKHGLQDDVLSHYEARLVAGFQRHLAHSREFYRSGGDGEWWRTELVGIERGIKWCHNKLGKNFNFRYQLRDFELYAVQ